MSDPRKRRRSNRTGTPRRGGPARLPELHVILSAQVKHLLIKSDPELRQLLRQHHRMVVGLLSTGRVTLSTADTNIKQLVNLGAGVQLLLATNLAARATWVGFPDELPER
jgi:hypothetical protein